ncbi:phage late control D family protein [Ideonella sp. YS5]|uniref:phage late control D family protein n=1 Tax=Ideonella sp. YS5 TaxID=3453714 RepID=UPI003EF0483E
MSSRDGFDVLAPQLTLKVRNEALPAPAAADVIGVTVLEDIEAAGMVEFTIAAWDAGEMRPRWIDDRLFDEGAAIEVLLGYRDDLDSVFQGEITGLEPEFPQGAQPRLVVRAHDLRHRMMRACRTRSFTQCKDSDIAAEIASAVNLRPNVDDSGVTLPYVLQHNQTDLEFLSGRARRIGFEVWVRGDELLFRRPAHTAEPVLTLMPQADLLSFRPRSSTLRQVTQLEVRGWDVTNKREFVGRGQGGDEPSAMAGVDDDQVPQAGPSHTQRAVGDVASARVTSPLQSQDEADAMARGAFADMALGFIVADGVSLGMPQLRAGTVARIGGVGERFGGAYYLTSVEHVFSRRGGYRTRFRARRNAR